MNSNSQDIDIELRVVENLLKSIDAAVMKAKT